MANTSSITIRKIKSEEYISVCNLSALNFNWSNDVSYDTDKMEYFKNATESPDNKYSKYWDSCYGAFDGDKMVSSITFLPYEVEFDGGKAALCGVGGVCTLASHRRLGLVRKQFELAFADAYNEGKVFSFLYPFSQFYYEQFGYKSFERKSIWRLHLKYIPDYKFKGSFTLYEGSPDTKGFEQAYESYAKCYNMMCTREQFEWEQMQKNCNPFKGDKQAYLYRDENSNGAGYFIFEKKEEDGNSIMWARELAFADMNALRAILSFASRFSDDYAYIELSAPANLCLEQFCTDFVRSRSETKLEPNGMVRVVNVKAALELASYKGSGKATISVEDNQIPQNNGIWAVKYENGKARSVELTAESADITMGIGEFSLAICGKYSIQQLADMPSVSTSNSKELENVFFHKPMFITTEF